MILNLQTYVFFLFVFDTLYSEKSFDKYILKVINMLSLFYSKKGNV